MVLIETGPSPKSRWAGRHIVVCNWRDSSHPQAGGAELYCEEVAEEFARHGAQVTLVTSRPAGAASEEATNFGRVVRRGGPLSTYPFILLWLFRHRFDIDAVVDSENGIPYFSALAVRRRTPVVLLIHHVHQEQFRAHFSFPTRTLGQVAEKWGSRLVYRGRPICVVSPTARVATRRQLGLKGAIFLAPNGAPRAGDAKSTSARHPTPRVVCVGRLVVHKRYDLLLRSLPEVVTKFPDLDVHIVGDGDQRESLSRQLVDLDLQKIVTMHGRLPAAERDALLASAWITVNPSAGEGWGVSVIEAASLGVPTVAFAVPGLRDSVRVGATGWLAEPGDDLGPLIQLALDSVGDLCDREVWARRCIEWSGCFSWTATASRILSVLASEEEHRARDIKDRRSRSDSCVVVALPRESKSQQVVANFRQVDQLRVLDDRIEVLMDGADEHDAREALKRVEQVDHVDWHARLARHRDLFGWPGSLRLDARELADEVDGGEGLPMAELPDAER